MLCYIVIWYTSNSLQACELQPTRLLCPWDSLGKNTGVGNHIPLQGIFATQGLNLCLLHCRQILYLLSHQGREQYTVSHSVQFSSVVQLCLTLCNPMNRSTPGLPVHHKLPEFTQTHAHRVVMPSSHLILRCPLLLPPITPSISVFSNESTLRMRWPKYWSFKNQIEFPVLYSRSLLVIYLTYSNVCKSILIFQFISLSSLFPLVNIGLFPTPVTLFMFSK